MSDANATQEAVTHALETMAFVSAWPADACTPRDCPTDPVLATIEFDGQGTGQLELVTSRDFARQLAANLLCIPDPSAASEAEAADALRELMNVACGELLRGRRTHEDVRFDMAIPNVRDLSTPTAWHDFLAAPETCVLEAEGTIVAVRVTEGAVS